MPATAPSRSDSGGISVVRCASGHAVTPQPTACSNWQEVTRATKTNNLLSTFCASFFPSFFSLPTVPFLPETLPSLGSQNSSVSLRKRNPQGVGCGEELGAGRHTGKRRHFLQKLRAKIGQLRRQLLEIVPGNGWGSNLFICCPSLAQKVKHINTFPRKSSENDGTVPG